MHLQDKLDAIKEKFESGSAPYNIPRFVVDAINKSKNELIATGQAERAIKAGDKAPIFSLKNTQGEYVNSQDLLAKGPLVVTFYRGVWCPYCNLDLQALEEIRSEIESRGASIVAVSMQTALNSRKAIGQNKLGFPILIDLDGEVANIFGIRFVLQDYLIDIYKTLFKIDLAIINDNTSWALPMPARYIIDQNGEIAFSEINPDYTQRPDPVELLPVLDRLNIKKAGAIQ